MSNINYRTVVLKDGRQRLRISSPYHPDFPAAAKKLGGTWQAESREWSFDPRDEARVRGLCREIFGVDGTEAAVDLVTIRIGINGHYDSLFVAGRQIAQLKYGRDGGVRLGTGVIVSDGDLGSGGSRKNPAIVAKNAIVEIRDVPRGIALKDQPAWDYQIIEQSGAQSAPVADAPSSEAAGLNSDGKELAALLALEDLIIHRAETGELNTEAESAWATYQKLKELAFRPGTDAEGATALKAAIKKAVALAL